MEPWDGPAAVAFTDGRVIGATLDRNGLRPGRWLETKDGLVVLGSETGVLDEPAPIVKRKGRLQPGKLFLVDLEEGEIVEDGEIKAASPPGSPTATGTARASSTSTTCPRRGACRAEPLRCASLRSATRRRTSGAAGADGGERPPSRSARWATTSRWRCFAIASRRCSPTSSSCSRRSRTRRSTRSASRS